MKERSLIITRLVNGLATAGHCGKCDKKFGPPSVSDLVSDEDAIKANRRLVTDYEAHECVSENFSQADAKQLAGELRKHADETRKRAKPGEDASQAAARIVREATDNK